MKSLLMVVAGLVLTVASGFPLNPSYTPEAVREYKGKADAGDAEAMSKKAFVIWGLKVG